MHAYWKDTFFHPLNSPPSMSDSLLADWATVPLDTPMVCPYIASSLYK